VELPLVDVAVAECDAGEERMVELFLGGFAGGAVGGVAVGGELDRERQRLVPVVEVGVEVVELLLGAVAFAADADLLGFEAVEGEGVGVVGVEQLVAFGVERGEPCGVSIVLVDGAALAGGDLGSQFGLDAGDEVGGELDALVDAVDLDLDAVGGREWLSAAGGCAVALAFLAEAEEVAVVVFGRWTDSRRSEVCLSL
jgi:hypothetical protein